MIHLRRARGREFCEILSAEAAMATRYSSGQAIAGDASGVAVSVVGHCLPEAWRREAELDRRRSDPRAPRHAQAVVSTTYIEGKGASRGHRHAEGVDQKA